MIAPANVVPPPARAWRKRLRSTRRKHHDRTLGDVLTDIYIMLWVFGVYGGILGVALRNHLREASAIVGPGRQAYWIGMAVLFAAAGLVWLGARSMGPLLATAAEQTWGVSTPVDRRRWLTPRFGALVLSAGVLATVMALVAELLAGHIDTLGWACLAGSAYGVLLAASVIAVQGDAPGSRWLRPGGWVLLGMGTLTALGVVAAHYAGMALPRPVMPSAAVLALVGLPLAVLAVSTAVRTLPHMDRARLSAGVDVAAATLSATVWLDPSLLSGVLEVRRWRHVGRVRSRGFKLGRYGRRGVLLQAELRRQLRRPGALGVWAAMALALYAVALVVPAAVGAVRILFAYVAAGRFMGGLRTLARSPGLRRALGGSETEQRLVHLFLPAVGTVLWWILTAPAGGVHLNVLELVMVAGVVGAAYRAATRPPLSYGGAVIETPIGLVPLELILQMMRGLDVLSVVFILHAIAK